MRGRLVTHEVAETGDGRPLLRVHLRQDRRRHPCGVRPRPAVLGGQLEAALEVEVLRVALGDPQRRRSFLSTTNQLAVAASTGPEPVILDRSASTCSTATAPAPNSGLRTGRSTRGSRISFTVRVSGRPAALLSGATASPSAAHARAITRPRGRVAVAVLTRPSLVHRQGRFGTFLGGPDARWRRWRKAQIQPGMRAFSAPQPSSERLDPPINAPTFLDGAPACSAFRDR